LSLFRWYSCWPTEISLRLVWTDGIAPPTISQGDTARAARDDRATAQPAQLAQSTTALAPSPIPTAGALPSPTTPPATGAVTPSAAVATPPATLAAQPSLASGVVINGGNLRTAPQVAANTVIGQVCPGDTLFLLEQNNQGWYRIRITTLAANCHPQRVAAETEGWLSSTLVRLQEP